MYRTLGLADAFVICAALGCTVNLRIPQRDWKGPLCAYYCKKHQEERDAKA